MPGRALLLILVVNKDSLQFTYNILHLIEFFRIFAE